MPNLQRRIHTSGAILMGLGSILGTGLFVSLAFATQIAGDTVLLAIIVAALLATLNGLSSAQLAATYPVSGGTYEYAYREVGPYAGFTAGWMFLVAKSASAATAAMGTITYVEYITDLSLLPWMRTALALGVIVVFTALVSGGIQRSNRVNTVVVSITLAGLLTLVLSGAWWLFLQGSETPPLNLFPSASAVMQADGGQTSWSSFLYASALMFVAYTGYGRIATLGEEVVAPQKTIPRAIMVSMLVIVILYVSVAAVALKVMGSGPFGDTMDAETAPLLVLARVLDVPLVARLVSVAAVTAMLGVLLNLLLGISRVVLAMARRADLPKGLSGVNATSGSPVPAVVFTGALMAVFVLTGDITFTWSLSAFTVLIYYSLTNLSALRMDAAKRLYPVFVPIGGLFGCLFLAFWIDARAWVPGVVLIATGLLVKAFLEYRRKRLFKADFQ